MCCTQMTEIPIETCKDFWTDFWNEACIRLFSRSFFKICNLRFKFQILKLRIKSNISFYLFPTFQSLTVFQKSKPVIKSKIRIAKLAFLTPSHVQLLTEWLTFASKRFLCRTINSTSIFLKRHAHSYGRLQFSRNMSMVSKYNSIIDIPIKNVGLSRSTPSFSYKLMLPKTFGYMELPK